VNGKTMDFQFLLEKQGSLSFHLTHAKKLAKH